MRIHGLAVLAAVVAAMVALVLGDGSSPALAEAQQSRHQFPGVVVDGDGEPVERLLVAADVQGGEGQYQQRTSAGEGTFILSLVEGTYRLSIWSGEYGKCIVSGIENPEGRPEAVFSVVEEGVTPIRLVVTTSDRPQPAQRVGCYFDVPFYRVQGTVRGPDQEPLEGIDVRLWRLSGRAVLGSLAGNRTGPDGVFAVDAPRGSYRLELTTEVDGGEECRLGHFGPDGRRAPAGAVTQLSVSTEDVAGFDITLAEPLSELCREVRGVVTDAEGNPLAGVWLDFYWSGEALTQIADGAGTFRTYLRDGSYRVTITTDRGGDCTIEGYAGGVPAKGDSFVVDGEGVSGLRFVLSGAPGAATRRVPCPYIDVITTELEPGWNLAGWTGPETAASAVFRAIPQVTAIYSWDRETQSFRGAIRQGPGSIGSLASLNPGMGLYLFVEGRQGVKWSRPFVTESALVSLGDGWNLVSWGGRDGATADDIFNSLGEEPVVAATWDASRGQFLLASTAAPAAAHTGLQVGRGDALWLQMPGEERWLQPGWPAPDIVLAGDSHYDDRDGYLQLVRDVQAFFARRYGAVTSEVTFYLASDRESLEDSYSRVRGDTPFPGFCADYGSQVAFIATYRCLPIAHEYFHAIQDKLSGGAYVQGPTWTYEGSAFYTDLQHRYSNGQASLLPGQRFTWATLGPEVTLETEVTLSSYEYSILLGNHAFEWLAGEAGEKAIIDYFALLKTSGAWEEAFHGAFGLTVDDFHARFEEHRREVAPPFEWRVTGTVLDRNSQPVEGIGVWVIAYVEGQLASNLLSRTGADGSFAIEHAPGSGYALLMTYSCPGGGRRDIGGYGQGGFTTDGRNAPPFTGEDRDRQGLAITLPLTLAEFERDTCGS